MLRKFKNNSRKNQETQAKDMSKSLSQSLNSIEVEVNTEEEIEKAQNIEEEEETEEPPSTEAEVEIEEHLNTEAEEAIEEEVREEKAKVKMLVMKSQIQKKEVYKRLVDEVTEEEEGSEVIEEITGNKLFIIN